jgi:hypothetical protein
VEQCIIATYHAVSTMGAQLHAVLSSSRGASLDVATQDTKEGANGGRKRCKQDR